MTPDNETRTALSKVPEVTLLFWILKILATTLGETGGDAVSMSMDLGYLVGTVIFAAVFAVAVLVQILAKKFHPVIYWTTIVATTTVGTTLADFADRSLGIGYPGGVAILVALLAGSLAAWRFTLGTISVESVRTPKAEIFYWVTIMFSQTLGTALGDWTADSLEFGYAASALIFGGLLAVVAAVYFWTRVSRTALFWAAFVLTRPLGAVVGDLLDKPHDAGGLALSRYAASGVLVVLMALGIALFRQEPAGKAH
ncbi:membrane protein [soil metagenome]